MKTYRSEQHGFEIDVPDGWRVPAGGATGTPWGESIVFLCGPDGSFNFQIGQSVPESLEQTEDQFRRYAQERGYTDLVCGRIRVGDQDHVWARYCMTPRDWTKKYLIVFGETECAITASCYDRQRLAESESAWDAVVASFRLVAPKMPVAPSSVLEQMRRALWLSEQAYSHFQRGHYQKALEQFRQGQMVSAKVPANYFGASMTIMQMIELGEIQDDQIPLWLAAAERDLEVCLLIAPTHQDYHDAMRVVREYKKKHNAQL
jgi:hypothetical protein